MSSPRKQPPGENAKKPESDGAWSTASVPENTPPRPDMHPRPGRMSPDALHGSDDVTGPESLRTGTGPVRTPVAADLNAVLPPASGVRKDPSPSRAALAAAHETKLRGLHLRREGRLHIRERHRPAHPAHQGHPGRTMAFAVGATGLGGGIGTGIYLASEPAAAPVVAALATVYIACLNTYLVRKELKDRRTDDRDPPG
jgi:hypothetical protein